MRCRESTDAAAAHRFTACCSSRVAPASYLARACPRGSGSFRTDEISLVHCVLGKAFEATLKNGSEEEKEEEEQGQQQQQ
jgi:hypothetical protein